MRLATGELRKKEEKEEEILEKKINIEHSPISMVIFTNFGNDTSLGLFGSRNIYTDHLLIMDYGVIAKYCYIHANNIEVIGCGYNGKIIRGWFRKTNRWILSFYILFEIVISFNI